MSSPAVLFPLAFIALIVALIVAFTVYVVIKYTPVVGRIFEEKPVFLPLRVPPEPGGEDVRFASGDGLELAGTYYPAKTDTRAGVMVFCHEFLSDRWSFLPYVGQLRDLGFDIFTFDFRNHGESAVEAAYRPLQWVSDREILDLRAAIDYLRSRPDRDPAGVGLFGLSRGGGAALCVAAEVPEAWGLVTDGAFPTHGTMLSYIDRFAEIYIGKGAFSKSIPDWMFNLIALTGRLRIQRLRGCRYPSVERAASRLSPRPWLLIHGAKDAYISPKIALELFARAGDPKASWIVPKAKHNRCRDADPVAYAGRVDDFLSRFGPRRPAERPEAPPTRAEREVVVELRPLVAFDQTAAEVPG